MLDSLCLTEKAIDLISNPKLVVKINKYLCHLTKEINDCFPTSSSGSRYEVNQLMFFGDSQYYTKLAYVKLSKVNNDRVTVCKKRYNVFKYLEDIGIPLFEKIHVGTGLSKVDHPALSGRSGKSTISIIKFTENLIVTAIGDNGFPSSLPNEVSMGEVEYSTDVRFDRVTHVDLSNLRSLYSKKVIAKSLKFKELCELNYLFRLNSLISGDVVDIGGRLYGQLREKGRECPSGRVYTTGISVQTMKSEWRRELLRNYYEYDLKSAALNWAINASGISLSDCPHVLKYMGDKKGFHTEVFHEMLMLNGKATDLFEYLLEYDLIHEVDGEIECSILDVGSVKSAILSMLFGSSMAYSLRSIGRFVDSGICQALGNKANQAETAMIALAFKESPLAMAFFTELSYMRRLINDKIRGIYLGNDCSDKDVLFGFERAVEAFDKSKIGVNELGEEVRLNVRWNSRKILATSYQYFETRVLDYVIDKIEDKRGIIALIHDGMLVTDVLPEIDLSGFGFGIELGCKSSNIKI